MTIIRNITSRIQERTAPGALKKVHDDHVLDYLASEGWALAGDDPEANELAWEQQQKDILAAELAIQAARAEQLSLKIAAEGREAKRLEDLRIAAKATQDILDRQKEAKGNKVLLRKAGEALEFKAEIKDSEPAPVAPVKPIEFKAPKVS